MFLRIDLCTYRCLGHITRTSTPNAWRAKGKASYDIAQTAGANDGINLRTNKQNFHQNCKLKDC